MLRVAHLQRVLQSAVLCAAVLLALPATGADPAPPSFDDFFATFKQAVARKDEAALRKMMAPDFSFIRGTNVAWNVVFEGLAADNGRQWANLQQAVQGEVLIPPPASKEERPKRVLRCTPTEINYNCLVVFEQDKQDRWRWTGMIMPARATWPIPPIA